MDRWVAKAVNSFGAKLYKRLAAENTNLIFSPLGISSALSMLFCGSKEFSAEEMRRVLGYEDLDIEDEVIKFCPQQMIDSLYRNQIYYTFHCLNAVLVREKVAVKEEYRSLLEVTFKALFKEMDFIHEDDAAVELVNNWIKKETDDKIPQFLDYMNCYADTHMMVFNGAYFKGHWLKPFEEERTYPQYFCNKDSEEEEFKHVDMMHGIGPFRYMEKDSYKVLQLPYRRRGIFLLILLPNSEDGLSALEDSLNIDILKEVERKSELVIIEVVLPVFRLEDSIPLKRTLTKSGLVRLFDGAAYLNISEDPDPRFNIDMNQTAILEVNDKGCEPFFSKNWAHGIHEKRKPFVADHPFMVVVYNGENNVIMLMGRVKKL